jgi:hypothetical protein
VGTSPFSGRIQTGRGFNENAALDAGFTRDFVLNNLCHAADEFAQVRVAWGATSSAFDDTRVGITGFASPVTGTIGDTWYPLYSFGPWPIPLRVDGTPYRMRILLAAAAPNVNSVIALRAVLCPAAQAPTLVYGSTDNVWESATFTTTTGAFLTGASQGSNAWATQVSLTASQAAPWVVPVSTISGLGGDPMGASQCLVGLHVYYSTFTTVDGASPILIGAYAAEFVGA